MSILTCHISISVDGYVAGPNQSKKNPLGKGGSACMAGPLRWPPGAKRTVGRAARRTRARGSWRSRSRTSAAA